MNPFFRMLAESKRLSLPLAFTRDLTFHDRNAINARPGEPFVWSISQTGTHMLWILPSDQASKGPNSLGALIETIAHNWPGSFWFVFDGRTLIPCADPNHARDLAHEVRRSLDTRRAA